MKVIMEHSQKVQHPPKQVRRLRKSSNIFIHLLTRHPGFLLTGLLTMLMVTTGLALYSLGYVENADNVEPEEIAAVVEKPMTTSTQNSNPTPLWLVMAIAFSCASGCSMIFRLVNRPHQPKKVRKPIIGDRASRHLTPNHRPRWETRNLKNSPVFVALQPRKPTNPRWAKSQPSVRVIPSKPRKETLADLMDIRQQNSLSTILQKY
ncbi:hypothetical protein [Nodularia spumigena]|uniref:Transmembrane protein n=1 Tax=Nodularia spumigena UHCC 0060 TaxID=3110300 RepID=A0ABU5UMH6_NODSP|nr:hypothetical protein [Nodularia spumigena]MEA5524348.1 hypothetical protein [Nodularia spumigena UHCC 0143]MEA5556058.1 hypothetical protein [Nodularia spumigena CH309]MEA5607312.1 hypothetical protein [Nodularia spumigena UHCC 0060]MEA5611839.1 hypothetical protein [Nodularia spumigena UHCC 0040]